MDIIKCPQCGNSLPPSFTKCHLCGADLAGVPRPPGAVKKKYVDSNKPKWVVPAYYVVAGYFILSGIVLLILGTVQSGKDGFPIFVGISSLLNIAFGLGLALRIEFIRGIANVFCFLGMLGALYRGVISIMLSLILGPLGLISLFLAVIDFCTNGFMIYLIGETD